MASVFSLAALSNLARVAGPGRLTFEHVAKGLGKGADLLSFRDILRRVLLFEHWLPTGAAFALPESLGRPRRRILLAEGEPSPVFRTSPALLIEKVLIGLRGRRPEALFLGFRRLGHRASRLFEVRKGKIAVPRALLGLLHLGPGFLEVLGKALETEPHLAGLAEARLLAGLAPGSARAGLGSFFPQPLRGGDGALSFCGPVAVLGEVAGTGLALPGSFLRIGGAALGHVQARSAPRKLQLNRLLRRRPLPSAPHSNIL